MESEEGLDSRALHCRRRRVAEERISSMVTSVFAASRGESGHDFPTDGWVLNGPVMVQIVSVEFRNPSSPIRKYIRGTWEPTIRMYSSAFRAS